MSHSVRSSVPVCWVDELISTTYSSLFALEGCLLPGQDQVSCSVMHIVASDCIPGIVCTLNTQVLLKHTSSYLLTTIKLFLLKLYFFQENFWNSTISNSVQYSLQWVSSLSSASLSFINSIPFSCFLFYWEKTQANQNTTSPGKTIKPSNTSNRTVFGLFLYKFREIEYWKTVTDVTTQKHHGGSNEPCMLKGRKVENYHRWSTFWVVRNKLKDVRSSQAVQRNLRS